MWASLQLAQLKKCDTETQVRRRLGKLPKTLIETYNELYDVEDPESQKYLRRAVTWVMNAHQPLSTEEILAAVRLSQHHVGNVTQLKVDEERLTDPALEKICRFLLVKDPGGHWKFPHASVEEYFHDHENERLKDWIGDKAQIEVAKLSVLLLTSYVDWSGIKSSFEVLIGPESSTESLFTPKTPESVLQRYVGQYWFKHVGEIQPQTEAYKQVAHLLQRYLITEDGTYYSSLEYRSWLEHWAKLHFDNESKALDMRPAKNSAFGIVTLGLFAMTEYWGTEQLDLRQINDQGYDLLALAACDAQAEVCETLISLGSDANRLLRSPGNSNGTSALCEAIESYRGDDAACVKVLLEHGADPNLETGSRALCCAAKEGHVEVLRLLLDHEANPNALCKDCGYECALQAATMRGSTNAIDLLIKAGAEVDLAYGRSKMTPLMNLVYRNYVPEAVEALVSHGADVHVSSGPYGGVMGAAFCGRTSDRVVPYLIENVGADPHRMLSDVMKERPRPLRHDMDGREKTARYLLQHKHLAPEDFRGLDDGEYLPPDFIENFKLGKPFSNQRPVSDGRRNRAMRRRREN